MTDNGKAKHSGNYLAEMGFSVRVYNHLIIAGYYTAEDLLFPHSLDTLTTRRGFGKGSRMEVIKKMRQHGYTEWADRMEVR